MKPDSVIDIGCGTGTWLAVFAKHGVERILGVDGDWVPENALEIQKEFFQKADLNKPYRTKERFDLAISLEVAEHLPEECAENFVKSLVDSSPVILFSAAIPGQHGVGHHNEKWPDYWVALFAKFDYVPIDCIRGRFWEDKDVAPWYAQNSLVFVQRAVMNKFVALHQAQSEFGLGMRRLVHPTHFAYLLHYLQTPAAYTLSRAVKLLLGVIRFESNQLRVRVLRRLRSSS